MLAQQPIAFAHAQAQVGKRIQVLVEGLDDDERVIGRSPYDAPEIDPHVVLEGEGSVAVGDLITVEVTGTEDYDLVGEIVP